MVLLLPFRLMRRASLGVIMPASVDPAGRDDMTDDLRRHQDPSSGTEEWETGSGSYLAGARAAIPFALATFVLGISFGVLARSLGWGTVAPIVFSVITFSGSGQFAVAAVLGDGGGALAAVVAAVLINARFGPMGLAIAPYLKGGPLRRALDGQARPAPPRAPAGPAAG